MYQTIVLEMLRTRKNSEMAYQLKLEHNLLARVKSLAEELKTSHEDWKIRMAQAKPGSNEDQIAAEALEMAIKDLENSFSPTQSETQEPLSLDGAMAYVRKRHTPPA